MKSRRTSLYILKLIALVCLTFCILYNFSFQVVEKLTTGRLAICFFFIWVICCNKIYFRRFRTSVWLLLLPAVAAIVQSIFSGDFGQMSRFFHLFLYSFIGSVLLVALVKDLKTLLLVILIAISIQSFFIFFSFGNIEFRIWLNSTIVFGGNFGTDNFNRAPGFSGTSGAALSVIQALGVFVGWLLIKKSTFYRPLDSKEYQIIVFLMLLSLWSCVLVGRTGLLLSIVFFTCAIIDKTFSFKMIIIISICGAASVFFFTEIISFFAVADFSTHYFISWVSGIFTGDDMTIKTINSMTIPHITWDTFFGTGLLSITNGGNPSGHDSGFIQTYYSLGLFFTALFYIFYFYVLYLVLYYLPLLMRIFLACGQDKP